MKIINKSKILLLLCVLLLLCGCDIGVLTKTGKRGNVNGNIINLGGACEADGVVYSQQADTYYLKAGDKVINSVPTYFINVVGDYIYYCNGTDNAFKVEKMPKEGGEAQTIIDGTCYFLQTDGKYLYYTNLDDNGRIYRAKLDGTEVVKLADETADYLNLYNDRLYYVTSENNYNVYSITTEGKGQEVVVKQSAYCLDVEDGYAYYVLFRHKKGTGQNDEFVGDNFLYRANLETKTVERVIEKEVSDINIRGDYLFYRALYKDDSNDTVSRLNLKTGKNDVLAKENGSYICVAGNKVFYLNRGDKTATVKEVEIPEE